VLPLPEKNPFEELIPTRYMQNEAITVKHLHGSEAITASLGLMRQLRPYLLDEAAYVRQVERQQKSTGYELVGAFNSEGLLLGLAGFVCSEMLSRGRYLYVDDLVIDEGHRGQGVGSTLLTWLEARAGDLECTSLHLDCSNHRSDAHRFYRREGLEDRSLHFVLELETIR